MSRRIGLFASIATLAAAPAFLLAAANPARAQVELTGAYRTWDGAAAFIRQDGNVNFDWGAGSPAAKWAKDDFTVVWTGRLTVPVTGDYRLATISDDAVRLTVDGRLLIENMRDHSATRDVAAPIRLEAGRSYDVTLEYWEHKAQAVIKLLWTPPGGAEQVIPRGTAVAPPLGAPAGLTAAGQWDAAANAPLVSTAWQPLTGAVSYNLYRDGVKVKSGLGTPALDDTAVAAGGTYSYVVSAVDAAGREGTKSAAVSAKAPNPPAATGQATAPTNLRIKGAWVNNGPTDVLTWDPVPGAKGYNVYQYDVKLATVANSTYTVPTTAFRWDVTYTVTAIVDGLGTETLPSNIVRTEGAANPASTPSWVPDAPVTPVSLVATPEWNAGRPRVALAWRGHPVNSTYNVYRDGKLLAEGLWGLAYIDASVGAGEPHVYTVTGVNRAGNTPRESAQSPVATATTLTAAPKPAGTKVQITGVASNDDSVVVSFSAIPGARDYRVYNAANPNAVKYSGGGLSVEWNGIDPAKGATLVVEAVDKLGPYQKMDGEMGPGAMDGMGTVRTNTNGLGDPSNVPNVLAASDPFPVACRAVTLTGSQVFFDNFRGSTPFAPVAVPPSLSDSSYGKVAAVANDKWLLYNVFGDLNMSRVFVMGNHFMDTLYDGGTVGSNDPLHQSNASIVMQPKATADFSNGRVLHVTFEVDAHMDGRRWCDVIVAGADDALLNPGKFAENNLLCTKSGNVFRWEVRSNVHMAQRFLGMDGAGNLARVDLFDQQSGVGPDNFGPPARTTWDGIPVWNGTGQDLDRRHKFDLYLSRTRFAVYENGTLIKDKAFPAGSELPFGKANVYFVHQAYHTDLDRQELIQYGPSDTYWINHRPYADERHWDNMGFEVVPAFPNP
jgi:hypothetical protein